MFGLSTDSSTLRVNAQTSDNSSLITVSLKFTLKSFHQMTIRIVIGR